MKKKRLASLFLALALGMAGCGADAPESQQGQENQDSGQSSEGQESQEEVSQAESTTGGSEEDMPTIVWGFLSNGGDYSAENENWPSEVFKDFQEAVRENTGVNVEFKSYPDNQAFELALAGGELPDMFEVSREYCTALLAGNHVLALDDYLDEYAPNLNAVSELRTEAMRKYFSKDGDGKMYFWTPYVGTEPYGSNWWNGMTIRWDWYKEAGYPEVKTEDDFLEVIKGIVEKHPETEDGKKVYGVATYSDGTLWGWWIRGCLYGYHNITDSYSMDIRDGKNKVINNYMDLDSPVWRDIRYYYKANQMGLFDPDSLTMKGDDLKAKATNGQLVSTICTWYGGSLSQNERSKDPESVAEYMVLPLEGQYNWGCQHGNIGWPFYHAVNAKTENVEAVMKVINYVNTPEAARIGHMGKEGRLWETVDGAPVIKEEAIDMKLAGGDEAAVQVNGLWPQTFGVAETAICADGSPANLWNSPDIWERTLTPAQIDFAEHYGVQVPSQVALNLIAEGKAFDKSGMDWDLMSLLPSAPQDVSRIDARCLDIMVKAMPRLVLAADQEEFDAVVEETLAAFEDAGVRQSIEWWEAQEAEIREFLDSARK